jgi:hypothetical protein
MTRPLAVYPRDWPLPHRTWEIFMWLVLIAVLSIAARESYGAERALPAGSDAERSTTTPRVTDAAPTTTDELFDDLAAAEDPALADHVAGGSLSAGELALVIVFLILLFPVGIILLIIFLVDDD